MLRYFIVAVAFFASTAFAQEAPKPASIDEIATQARAMIEAARQHRIESDDRLDTCSGTTTLLRKQVGDAQAEIVALRRSKAYQ